MLDLPGSPTTPDIPSDMHPVPATNAATVPAEPSTGMEASPTSAATGETYLNQVSNVFFPRKNPLKMPRTIRPPLVQRIEDHPRGYPRLAAFQETDDFFKIYRRFGFLRGRLLLDRQIELAQLEEKLHAIDKEDSERWDTSTMSRNPTEGRTKVTSERFRDLMKEIDEKLVAYDNLVLRAKAFVALVAPHSDDMDSVGNHVANEAPLVRNENAFLERTDDFLSFGDGHESGWFDIAVSRILDLLPRNSFLITTSEQRKLTDQKVHHLRDKAKVDAVVRTVLFATTVLLLVGPSALRVVMPKYRGLEMVLTSVFTALFAALLSLSTKGGRHEIMAATALYCAVLVVVLSSTAAYL